MSDKPKVINATQFTKGFLTGQIVMGFLTGFCIGGLYVLALVWVLMP